MGAHRSPRWSAAETAILREHYPAGGLEAVQPLLPARSWHSIYVKANKLGLRCARPTDAPEPKLAGDDLEEAIRLREVEGWSFARIGAHFGVAEASACNAVLIALCPRKGYRPAERDEHGRLTAEGLERLRLALRKGLKGVDIQLRLGLSASCIAEQRRRYNRELKARGKAPLPPPGAGEMYSGVKLTRAKKAEVEALFMQGLGTLKVSQRSGVSKTSCTRIRNRLIRRLKRQGQTLPGCDERGVRRAQAESSRFVPAECKAAVRAMLLDRIPVRRAAMLAAVGSCSAYRIRDELAAEMAARGEELPKPILPGRRRVAVASAHWPPAGASEIYAFRELLREMPFDAAKAEWCRRKRVEREAEKARPRSFEEQLERIRRGEIGIAPALARHHLEPIAQPQERRAA
jgi:hypothetical protein